ncbi:LCP family glycopolymer transferase [Brachybacterium alimentarium]|uniref:LCP family glycopolymer transferase n=1 Tax=Brachybacterium alimentarium TaxID=47845 RepID=UPI003FD59F24
MPPRRPRGRRAAYPLPAVEPTRSAPEQDADAHNAWLTDPSAAEQDTSSTGLAPHSASEPAAPSDLGPTTASGRQAPSPARSAQPTVVPGRTASVSASSGATEHPSPPASGSPVVHRPSAQSPATSPEGGDSSTGATAAAASAAAVPAAADVRPWADGSDASGSTTEAASASSSGSGGARGPGSSRTGGAGGSRSSHGPADTPENPSGSLPKVAGWTVLTTLVPGTGLLTTRMRRLGWVLLALLVLAVIVLTAVLVFGDPLRTGMMIVTNRALLIGILVAAGVAGLVWAAQIVLANLAHTTRQRLQGAKKYLALALAALMVVAIAVPFGRGVQSVWAVQALLGSKSVFGGQEGGESPIVKGKDPWAGTDRVNIMLLGQDSGEDRTGTRPDTIMMASIDTSTGKTALFSIPRNLEGVRFPEGTAAAEEFPDGFDYFGKNQDLINAVWTWADDRPDLFPDDPEPGLTATTWAVEETLGLETDYYAMVNLQGFEDLVNAIGGVDLVVERRIPIGGGTNQATGGKYPIDGYIEPGDQKLDGFHALWYARSREGSNDFNRMCRQQRMVRAVTEEAQPATVAVSVPGLVTATEENIQTNIPTSDIDAFVDLALRVKEGGFTSYPITPDVTNPGNPDWDELKKWSAASIEDSMEQDAPESVVGETEPGSTAPAETAEDPEESKAEGGEAEEPPADESSTDATSDDDEKTDDGPEIDKDPLRSCLPGAEEG